MAGLLRVGMSVEPTVNTKAAVIAEGIKQTAPSAANTVPVAQQPIRSSTPAG
jgi:hypothetical protein